MVFEKLEYLNEARGKMVINDLQNKTRVNETSEMIRVIKILFRHKLTLYDN